MLPATLKRIIALLGRQERISLATLTLVLLSGVAMEALGLGMVLPLLRLIIAPHDVHNIPILERAYQLSGLHDEQLFLVATMAALWLVIVIKNLVLGWGTWYQMHTLQSLRVSISSQLYERYIRSPYLFHVSRNSGILIRNLAQSTTIVFNSVLTGYVQLFAEFLVTLGILGILMAATPEIAIGAFAVGGLLFIAFNHRFKRVSQSFGHRRSDYLFNHLRILQETFPAAKEISVLHRQDHFVRIFKAADEAVASVNTSVQLLNTLPRLLVEALGASCLLGAGAIVLMTSRSNSEVLTMIGITAAAAMRLIPSLGRMLQASNNIQTGSRFVDDIYEDCLSLGREMPEIPVARPFSRSIRLEDVDFRYEGAERPALQGINLEIRAGESVALVGPSGAGKSTLADIVLGLLRPNSGRILLNGETLEQNETICGVGYVPQSMAMIDNTLRRNVAFGEDDAEIDDARVRRALVMAQLEDLLDSLPDGLDARLGENAVRLSGGQRQRVGIARALYHQPELLVLDEATAALDVETERRLSNIIHNLTGSKTLLIVAHRLSTVRECSRIAYMEDGRILDIGPFDELYHRNNRFRDLVGMAELRPNHDLP